MVVPRVLLFSSCTWDCIQCITVSAPPLILWSLRESTLLHIAAFLSFSLLLPSLHPLVGHSQGECAVVTVVLHRFQMHRCSDSLVLPSQSSTASPPSLVMCIAQPDIPSFRQVAPSPNACAVPVVFVLLLAVHKSIFLWFTMPASRG